MGINKRLKYISGLCTLTIAAISIFFHYPVQIIDALTLEALPDYDFHIPIWKILFEPILGILLFFNRGLFAIDELFLSLYWALIIFISYSILKAVLTKDSSLRKKFFLNQLVNLPFVIGLWFTIFVIILFMSPYMPANTIINNSPNTILVTTHSHTQFSHDGLIRQKKLWGWHKYNNFDAFFITDHNTHDKTIDFVNAQRNGEFPIEPLVMGGEEFSGSNHLSLLGLKRKFDTHGYSDTTVIDSVRANNGAVIVNHWFDGEHMSLEYYKSLNVDGFEIENSATETSYDREIYHKIKDFCESNKLIMNGGLDFHGYGNVCTIWNAMEIPGWHKLNPNDKEEAILNVIRNQDQNKLKVLMYKDRPYYSEKHLFWRPVFTFFNYFRTLNVWQILSWTFWILLITFIKIKISSNEEMVNKLAINKIVSVLGVLSAIFMLTLAGVYHTEIQNVIGSDNDVYEEYSMILFYAGAVFLTYSGIVAFFRIFRNKNSVN
ncbi:MAG: hypothetical protein ABFS35_20160 [Bacteroidota bacterium]